MMKRQVMVGLVAAAAQLTAFGAIRAVTPTAWQGGKPDSAQMKRHQAKMELVRKGGSKVVFIGDWAVWDWPAKGVWNQTFGGEPYKALDLSFGGDRTENVLWRITEGGELDGYEAKCVVLSIGASNWFEPALDTILGIRAVIRTIRAKQPKAKVVLVPILPRGRTLDAPQRRHDATVNRELRKLADGRDVLWCDFNDSLLTLDGELLPDVFHPSLYGYVVFMASVKPYVDAALSDDAVPMPPNRLPPFIRRENFRTNEQCSATYPTMAGAGWFDRMLEKRNQAADAKGAIDLVFLGDSITHGWEGAGGKSLAELRKTYSVIDLGYSCDRTEHVIWRIENGELDGYRAKCVMLMIGTNNGGKPEIVSQGVRRILDIIAKKQPQAKVLLLPIFPSGPSEADKHRVQTKQVNAEIEKFADGKRVIWCDFNDKFLDEKGDVLWCMPDRLHPNAAAYRDIWVPAVLPHFKKICGK